MYKTKHILIAFGIILSIITGILPTAAAETALTASDNTESSEELVDTDESSLTASPSDADVSPVYPTVITEELPILGDIGTAGFSVEPSGVYVNQVITGTGSYFSETHNLLNCTGPGANGMAAYCIEPAKAAPSSAVPYTEVGMTNTKSSSIADKAAAAAVCMYGYGGLSSINNDILGFAEANTNMGGTFGVYVVDGTAYTGIHVNGTFFKMSYLEAHALTAAVIHKLNGSGITSVTGSLLSSDSQVAEAYEYLYSLGSYSRLNTDVNGWDSTNALLSAYTPSSQTLEIKLKKSNGESVSVPADSKNADFDWSPYIIDGKINYEVTYRAFRCESRLIKSVASSGTNGKITYTHEAATAFKDYPQANGCYDYISISEGSGNTMPINVSYGKLKSRKLQSIRLGVIDPAYGGFPPCDGVEFFQTVTITADVATLKSGKTLDLKISVPQASGYTPYYGDGDGKDGSYCASRFFSAYKYQDMAVASPNSSLSGCEADIYAKQETGTIKLNKASSLTNITDGNSCYSLRLAKYGLYESEADARARTNAVRTFTTDENGEAAISGIPLKTYYIAEITPPKGYRLDQNIYKAVLSSAKALTVNVNDKPEYNTPELLIYKKSDKDVPLEGAVFTVSFYADDLKTEDNLSGLTPDRTWYLKSDSNGCVYLDETHLTSGDDFYKDDSGSIILPYGTLTVTEKSAPEGYIADDALHIYNVTGGDVFTVENISEDRIYTNKSFEAYVKINKYDIITGKLILDNPAAFRIWSYDEVKYVEFTDTESGQTYTDLYADEQGTVCTPAPLFYGKYGICEAKEPVGYYNEAPDCFYDFEITEESTYETYDDGNCADAKLLICDIYNTPLTGQLEIYKTGDVRSWDTETEEFITDICPLADVQFDIIAAEDIFSADNQQDLIYGADEVIETLTTDADGYALSSDSLPMGKYIVREHVPDGYEETDDIEVIISSDDVPIEAETDGRIKKVVIKTLNIHNVLKIPELMTSAIDNISGTNTGVAAKQASLTDVVEYKNLIIGETYTIKGAIIDKESGLAYTADGTELTGETTFVCESENGTVNVDFSFDASDMAGKSIVLYETLYREDEITAVHADIDNKAQTINYPPVETPPDTPKTNDIYLILPCAIVGIITLITILSIIKAKYRKKI